MKRIYYLLFFAFVAFISLEALLRIKWGFGTMPLFQESDHYEYIAKPNQDLVRFGCHYYTNSYCQRSDEPDYTKTIVLGLGDSVINGGSQTDNYDLATSIFSRETGMQMLNISAGSWGADNCSAYLKEHGIFNAKAIFVLLSSHDAHDVMSFQKVVGESASYPRHQYPLAIVEVIDRYAIPRIKGKIKRPVMIDPDQQVLDGIGIDKGGDFNPGWDALKQIANDNEIPLIVCLHADKLELQNQEYNGQGKMIINWAEENDVQLVKDMELLDLDCYRDGIHINKKGQRVIADIMKENIK